MPERYDIIMQVKVIDSQVICISLYVGRRGRKALTSRLTKKRH